MKRYPLIVWLLLISCPSISAAQADTDNYPGLVLARICVHEAGWLADKTGDCDGIYQVLKRVGRNNLVRGAWRYAPRAMLGISGRPWVVELGQIVPSALSRIWQRVRNHWSRIMRYAHKLTTGTQRARCRPDHLGVRTGIDWDRAQRAGWREVDCGNTLNAFWSRKTD